MVKLEAKNRAELADRIIQHLLKYLPASTVRLRGSLTSGNADIYSDIDLLWEVPDGAFPACLEGLPGVLGEVAPLLSLRSDPDFQNSLRRRLLFISFENFPLFWRVDLSVMAASLKGDETFDVGNLAVRSYEGWSWQESALFNGVAVLKNHLRCNSKEAQALLERAYTRINQPFSPYLSFKEQLLNLIDFVEGERPQVANLTHAVRTLIEETV